MPVILKYLRGVVTLQVELVLAVYNSQARRDRFVRPHGGVGRASRHQASVNVRFTFKVAASGPSQLNSYGSNYLSPFSPFGIGCSGATNSGGGSGGSQQRSSFYNPQSRSVTPNPCVHQSASSSSFANYFPAQLIQQQQQASSGGGGSSGGGVSRNIFPSSLLNGVESPATLQQQGSLGRSSSTVNYFSQNSANNFPYGGAPGRGSAVSGQQQQQQQSAGSNYNGLYSSANAVIILVEIRVVRICAVGLRHFSFTIVPTLP
ncbi:unnamed protein product [Soboliphyme baturini]|uniref:Uncharacterized protein n=1 Tax=Soboliphyme baturini TaxID=241478 RepID=A0A183IYQ8_9BILA|nr:unnamed protein product [Soboliphyme baturini]